jgi:hypothetical protein
LDMARTRMVWRLKFARRDTIIARFAGNTDIVMLLLHAGARKGNRELHDRAIKCTLVTEEKRCLGRSESLPWNGLR